MSLSVSLTILFGSAMMSNAKGVGNQALDVYSSGGLSDSNRLTEDFHLAGGN